MHVSLRCVVVFWVLALGSAASRVAAEGDVRLVEAVKSRDVKAVRALLNARADVNAARADGVTALHWAVHWDDLETADLLIRAGGRANAADDNGVTPLYLACTNRHAAMIEKLLAAGANPNATLVSGETVLMNCARTGAVSAVKTLVRHGADVNAKEHSRDQTALMWAVAQKQPQVVEALIAAGADIRARSRIYDQTVVGESTQRTGREELSYVVQRGGSTPLLFAARVGDADSARLLLAAGASVADALPDGMSALVLAAHSGQRAVVQVLLNKGANPNDAAIGYAALHAAVLKGDLDMVKALLSHGADPNARITKGTPVRRSGTDFELPATLIGATPYFLAAKFLEVEIMPVLVAAGANPRSGIDRGATPLMVAAGMEAGGTRAGGQLDRRGFSVIDGATLEDESRVLAAVSVALVSGSDINAVNDAGETALHYAAALGYDLVVQLLVDRGADLAVKNTRGQTALGVLRGGKGPVIGGADSYRDHSHQSTVDLLRRLGAVE
jgi:ankyrin repeat protein